MNVATSGTTRRTRTSIRDKRVLGALVALAALIGLITGTKVVSNDDVSVSGADAFDAKEFGDQKFGEVRSWVVERAVDAPKLATAIDTDADAAATEFAQTSTGTAIYSVRFTGRAERGASGGYGVVVEGLPNDLRIQLQTGPVITGTDLRDATGTMPFSDFPNQIDYQDAASALNDQVKAQVLAPIAGGDLSGATITVSGVFRGVNPKLWMVLPVEVEIQ